MRLAVVLTSSLGLSLALLAACSEQAPAEPAAPAVEAAPASAPEAVATEEAAGVAIDANTLTPEAISAMMVGSFQSSEDEKSTINIEVDGVWTESYEGATPEATKWRVFAGDAPPAGVTETFTPASRYLELTSPDGVSYYEMGVIDHNGFDMFYKARGNRLSYVRIKTPG